MTGDPEMDAADFAAYVEARRGYYLHLARQYLGNQQDAEDALAEAVCLGLRKLPGLREDGGIHAWMRRMVINCALSQLRKRRMELPLEALKTDRTRQGPADSWETFHQRMDILRVIQSRPLWEQHCIWMRCRDGFTFREIADLLDLPVETVKSRWYRSLARIRMSQEGLPSKPVPENG